MAKKNTFRIGICMAGAVSAGAYTAGVIDYLLEALENWQKAKDAGIPGIPKHDVIIEVLSGASAGGMTAAITAAAVQDMFPHINQHNYTSPETKNNPLFDAWVNLTEEPGKDMMDQMLNNDDIKNNSHNEVRAGFNSTFIDKIATRTLTNVVKNKEIKRPYIADNIDLLTTITNLRGFDYQLDFITELGQSQHRMTSHRDFTLFRLCENDDTIRDGKIPLSFSDANGLNKDLLACSAMSTGAFPIGLSPRVMKRDPRYINENSLLKAKNSPSIIVNPLNEYENVNVDGGVINNEPFELTEKILINRRKEEIECSEGKANAEKYVMEKASEQFDTTVLMIDPFPNYDDKPSGNYYSKTAIKYITRQLLGAMRQQLMFKSEDLDEVYNENNYTRFMVAPIRTKENVTQKYSIACGALGGFGGFFSKQFRIHDYMLGRRNCQRFIQKYFSVPVSSNNPIIQFGYEGITDQYLIKGKEGGRDYLPIIPDIRFVNNATEVEKPESEPEFIYPKIKLGYLLGLEKKLKNRFSMVLNNITNGNNPSEEQEESLVLKRIRKKTFLGKIFNSIIVRPSTNFYLYLGKTFGKGVAAELFLDAVIADMEKRGLLEEDV